ncbi:hypothetical protein [Zobellia laminariae]|uniref:hypothetical protein n=1 Tax=Zobellia laminariae TaxID=248906 RepID=UPI0026F45FDE|nr:hypothetical protein [Zobellia laminariae]WKX74711.1 hypothetical protein Q5W13_12925 [Zobellia laminariae]
MNSFSDRKRRLVSTRLSSVWYDRMEPDFIKAIKLQMLGGESNCSSSWNLVTVRCGFIASQSCSSIGRIWFKMCFRVSIFVMD